MASGIENCVEVIDYLTTGTATVDIVDLMACEGGCLGGPGSANNLNVFARRQKLIKYWESQMNRREATDSSELINLADAKLYRNYRNRKPKEVEVPEAEIQSILAMTGKYSKDDELNCGACGYQSCRDKAIACYRGLADPVMCIPYMRQRAESMANLIVSAIPSAIFVVSSEGQVLDVNRLGQILTQEPLHDSLDNP